MTEASDAVTAADFLASAEIDASISNPDTRTMFLQDYRTKVRFDDAKMAKTTLFESHRMFADLYCLQPGQEQRVHSHHDNDKLYFVLEGEGTFTSGSREERLSAGGCCVAPAGEPHGVRNDSDGSLVILVAMAPHPSPRS